MTDKETILLNFSVCSRCGHFLATLLSLEGKRPDKAFEGASDPWLEFNWQPAIAEALVTYFDLHYAPEAERYTGQCPTCQRKLVYEQTPEGACLRIEIRPGSQIESEQQD